MSPAERGAAPRIRGPDSIIARARPRDHIAIRTTPRPPSVSGWMRTGAGAPPAAASAS